MVKFVFVLIVVSFFQILASSIEITIDEPQVIPASDNHVYFQIKDLNLTGQPEAPILPMKSTFLTAPRGYKVSNVKIIELNKRYYGNYKIAPSSHVYPLSKGPSQITMEDPLIYNYRGIYPLEKSTLLSNQILHGFNFQIVNFYPITLIPATGETFFTSNYRIDYEIEKDDSPGDNISIYKKDFERIVKLADNKEMLTKINYEKGAGKYSYIIITGKQFINAQVEYNLERLLKSRTDRGITGTIKTVEDIYKDYTGKDNPEKIRNFIKYAYQTFGTRYVLLAGDADIKGENIVPVRGLKAEAEDQLDKTIAADFYYSCLDGNFDNNNNGIYGEPTDGIDGGDIDMLPEISVGRIPIDSNTELNNIVKKILTYENLPDNTPYLNNIIFAGEYLWNTDAGDPMYGDDSMEELKVESHANGINTIGYPTTFNFINLYERDNSYTKEALVAGINSGVHMINHLGHSINNMNMKLYRPDIDDMTNTSMPTFGYSQGCYPGAFDNKSPYFGTTGDAIIENFIGLAPMAFGFIGNTRYGWGDNNTTKGPSHMFHRQFIHAIFGEKIKNIADSNAYSKVKNIGVINETAIRWVMYELTYFGDPMVELKIK